MRFFPVIAGGLSAVLLAACGGGGGSSSPVGPGTPPKTGITLVGIVATGKAVAGAAVAATCASGGGTATSSSSGDYSLTVSTGSLPCVLQATSADGMTVLHSVATGAAGDPSTTANITSLTELLVANLTGQVPSSYFTSVAASSLAATITASAISAAQTAVAGTLLSAGIDTSAAGSFVTGTLVAGTSGATGNSYDAILDSLGTRLTSTSTTLAALTSTVAATSAASSGSTSTTSSTAVASLPAAVLLQPAASTCSALRSGKYRFVQPDTSGILANQFDLKTIDARALSFVNGNGSTGTLTPNGPCRFTSNGGADVVVSQAGVLVARSNNGTVSAPIYTVAIGFPEQVHSVAELAGTWNNLGLQATNGFTGATTLYTGTAATGTFSTTGVVSAVTFCQNPTTWGVSGADCTTPTNPNAGLTLAPDAGFYDGSNCPPGNTTCGRAFAYQAGNGDFMTVSVGGDGGFVMATKQRATSLPTVGTITTLWDVYLGNSLISTRVIDEVQHTILTVDSTALSWTRSQFTIGLTNTHTETLLGDNPRQGYNTRVGGTATTTTGGTVTVQPFTNLGMRGMGLSALILPNIKLFNLSVVEP